MMVSPWKKILACEIENRLFLVRAAQLPSAWGFCGNLGEIELHWVSCLAMSGGG